MSIQSRACDIRVRRTHGLRGLRAVRTWPISLRVKVVSVIFLSTILLILSAVAVGRMGVMPEIVVPPQAYLPGSPVPQLPKDAECFQPDYEQFYRSCSTHVAGQTLFITCDLSAQMIVHTEVLGVDHSTIGDLITVWGNPTKVSQANLLTVVYWGTRSAVVYTRTFRPESRVIFIQYELEEPDAPRWQGFRLRRG